MAKAKDEKELTTPYKPMDPEVSNEPILYDPSATQTVPLAIEKAGKEYRVAHVLRPITNARFFQLEKDTAKVLKTAKAVSTALFEPKQALWKELAESRAGYAENANWRNETHIFDCVNAVSRMLDVEIVRDEVDRSDDLLTDGDEKACITLRVMQSGVLIEIKHYFREESKAQLDRYMVLESGAPDEKQLASLAEGSVGEKLYRLGQELLVSTEGYVSGAEIPAWHLGASVKAYFLERIRRVGKF